MIIIQIKLLSSGKINVALYQCCLISLYDVQTYLLSPQLRALSLDLMGASPSSISQEKFTRFFSPVVTLMPVDDVDLMSCLLSVSLDGKCGKWWFQLPELRPCALRLCTTMVGVVRRRWPTVRETQTFSSSLAWFPFVLSHCFRLRDKTR